MQALTTTVRELSLLDAELIITRLTKPGSEFQAEVRDRSSSTPVAIVRSNQERVAAWTATHEWRGMQTLEGFTDPSSRRRGLARVAAALLIADGHIDPDKTLAVFSPVCVSLASGLSCRDVRLYERQGTEWVENS
jgi:hypothetical protein